MRGTGNRKCTEIIAQNLRKKIAQREQSQRDIWIWDRESENAMAKILRVWEITNNINQQFLDSFRTKVYFIRRVYELMVPALVDCIDFET